MKPPAPNPFSAMESLRNLIFMNLPHFPSPGWPALRPFRWYPVLLVAGFLLGLAQPPRLAGQATATPSPLLAYQGFITDANGNALATNAPQNFNIVFRIWNDPSATGGTNLYWSELQTVTVDHGNFGVQLGEGTAYAAEARPGLATVFPAVDASSRYVELTVLGIGSGGANLTILPRLRLLVSPYAFLATAAGSLVGNNGSNVISGTTSGLSVNGSITTTNGTVSAVSLMGALSGANLTAGSVGSNQIAAGAVGTTQLLAGSVGANQLAPGAIGTTQISNGAVGTLQITNGAVGSAQIANGAVGAAQIANGAVGPAHIATNLVVWSFTPTNIFYANSDVSVGSTAHPRNLTVNGNVNVQGALTATFGGAVLQQNTPIVLTSATPNDQTSWQIVSADVKPFASWPGGFKIRIYVQNEVAPYTIYNLEGTMTFEQPGYASGTSSFPNVCAHGWVTWSINNAWNQVFTIGTPPSGLSNDVLFNIANIFYVLDYYPGASYALPGGVNYNYKNNLASTYMLYFLFHPSWSGYVVISDY